MRTLQNQETLEKMIRHHDQLAQGLYRRAEALLQAAKDEQGSSEQRMALVAFLDEEIWPHAIAEEQFLYPVLARRADLRVLIESMVDEHGRLHSLAAAIVGDDALHDAAQAVVVAEFFAAHAAKENTFLLKPVVDDPAIDLATLLSGMAGTLSGGAHSREDVTLDVRALPHHQRHTSIFALIERLAHGQGLNIVVDHDPLPLRYQLESMYPGAIGWEYQERGPEVWSVTLRRLLEAKTLDQR